MVDIDKSLVVPLFGLLCQSTGPVMTVVKK